MLRRGASGDVNRELIERVTLGKATERIGDIGRRSRSDQPLLQRLLHPIRCCCRSSPAQHAPRAIDEQQQDEQREEGGLNYRDKEDDGKPHPAPPPAARRERSSQVGIFAIRIRRLTGFGR